MNKEIEIDKNIKIKNKEECTRKANIKIDSILNETFKKKIDKPITKKQRKERFRSCMNYLVRYKQAMKNIY